MNNPIQNVKEKLTKQNLKTFLLITFGTFIFAIGIYFFKFPNNFSTGGVSGISILLGRIFPSFSTAGIMWIINIILLIVGFIILGRGFGVLTVYCSMLLSFLTWLFEKVIPLSKPLTDQPFLELCYGMMLPAVGSAILFNCNASSGGTDIVAMILKSTRVLISAKRCSSAMRSSHFPRRLYSISAQACFRCSVLLSKRSWSIP